MAGLAAAMLEHHQRIVRMAPSIACDTDAAAALPAVHRLGGAWKSRACAHGADSYFFMWLTIFAVFTLEDASKNSTVTA
jgi:hypothetical protein